MIVCDICRDINKKAFVCYSSLQKEEEKKGKNHLRNVIRVMHHLCEECITLTCRDFHLLPTKKKTGS